MHLVNHDPAQMADFEELKSDEDIDIISHCSTDTWELAIMPAQSSYSHVILIEFM